MFCKHCGTQVDPKASFCHQCGAKIALENFSSDKQNPAGKVPGWFQFLLGVAILGLFLLGMMFLVRENLDDSVEEQLTALRSNKITEAYYNFTSKEFQNATPLDVFKAFIKTYPAFSSNKSISIDNSTVEDGIGSLDGTLVSQSGEKMQVQYKLVQEGDKWKILSIRLIESASTKVAEDSSTSGTELLEPIQKQLGALKNYNFPQAYQVVSKAFASDTPIEEFTEFVRRYPILLNFDKVEYASHTIKDGEGDVTIVLHSNEGPIPAEYKLVKEDGQWKIWGLKLYLIANEPPAENDQNIKPLFQVAKQQLKTLAAGDIAKAYDTFASKEFKNVTSFETFKNFIQRHPIFANHTSIHFQYPTIIDGRGNLKVEMLDGSQEIILEYIFGKEDGVWKILKMNIDKSPQIQSTSEPTLSKEEEQDPISKVLSKVIHDQLEAIYSQDFRQAYHEYTSEEFQKSTTLKEFIKFIENQPAFYANTSQDLNKLTFNNNIGTLSGTLTAKNSMIYSVEYDLIKEDNRWKILHILISPLTSESKND